LMLQDCQIVTRDFESAKAVVDRITGIIKDHVENDIVEFISRQTEAALFLQALNERYGYFSEVTTNVIHNILFYTHNRYKALGIIPQCSKEYFNTLVLHNPGIHRRMTESLVALSELARSDETSLTIIRDSCSVLRKLSDPGSRALYEEFFETPYFENCVLSINEFAEEELKKECPVCICEIESFIKNEERRAQLYDPQTAIRVHDLVMQKLVKDRANEIMSMNHGLFDMMDNKEFDNVRVLYNLFKPIPECLTQLQGKLEEYVVVASNSLMDPLRREVEKAEKAAKSVESDFVMKREDAVKVIGRILSIKAIVEETVNECFIEEEKPAFLEHMKAGLKHVMNDEQLPMARFLSIYIDQLITVDFAKSQEAAVDKAIGEVIALFICLDGRDAFERFYIQHLYYRLLVNLKQEYIDTELHIAERLRECCGPEFYTKAKNLIGAFQAAFSMTQEFVPIATNSDLNPLVLTRIVDDIPMVLNNYTALTLPPNIVKVFKEFDDFYMQKRGKKGHLLVLCNFGNANLQARLGGTKYSFVASTMQMLILVKMNEHPRLSVKDLADRLSVKPSIIMEPLRMMLGRKLLLRKSENPEKAEKGLVKETDLVWVNPKYSPGKPRVTLFANTPADSTFKLDEGKDKMEESRFHELQAQVVRVMKARKTLESNSIFMEVFKIVSHRFHPSVELFKTVIDWLLEHGYLERDDDDNKVFHYLA